ncbi:hypothetical protein [Owenweeksia hongkongensis]|uniref:hypothetical protein n=1 Tax=Owenweeksia hongkongensis TaxID=253245 RepID=UPI003A8DBF57
MAKAGLIFTTDYEIFGNGSGCVERCMIEPTERMASILEKYGANLTLFVDVCEYWAFEQEFASGKLKKDWAVQIKAQLQDLAKRGHDIQLHFHPQWLDYSFDGKNWTLNYDLWRIGKLKYEDLEFPERSLKNLFAKGKKTLEQIITPVKESYKCHIFRAGAWSMQPEKDVLKAMKENGFDIDSTVASGLSFQDEFTFYDFKNSPNEASWKIDEDLNSISMDGKITEIPIFTTEMPLSKKVKFLGLKKKKGIAMKPQGCVGTSLATAGKGRLAKLTEVLSEKRKMFTFGDATSFEEMTYFAKRAIKRAKAFEKDIFPTVAISHPKTFANERELDSFLEWVSKNNKDIEFTNYNRI